MRNNLKNCKSQAALEFLTTYAWAFLVILITISALYYFGVFDFAKFLPQRCLFTSQYECVDFAFVGDDVRFRLINNMGETINVIGLEIKNDVTTPLSCTLATPSPTPSRTEPFAWQNGEEQDFIFNACQDGAFLVGERAEALITMKYCSPATSGCPEHSVTGKINAVVNEE